MRSHAYFPRERMFMAIRIIAACRVYLHCLPRLASDALEWFSIELRDTLPATRLFAGTIMSPREWPPISWCCFARQRNAFKSSREKRGRLQISDSGEQISISVSLYYIHCPRKTIARTIFSDE